MEQRDGDVVVLRREALAQVMRMVMDLGTGRDLDDILQLIAQAVVDVIGFDAVAVNVRTGTGDLAVRTVVGPPELEEVRGGVLGHREWLEILESGEQWGELRFFRDPDLADHVPRVDPWAERIEVRGLAPSSFGDDGAAEPWQPQFALLAPLWGAPGDLVGVISVDLPRSGTTPDAEQRALLELFATQAAAAVLRVHDVDIAVDAASLYHAAFLASPAPTAVLDGALRVVETNGAFLELSDAVEGELTGLPLERIVALPAPGLLARTLELLPPGRSTVVAEECPLLHPRGQTWDRWVHVAVQRVDTVTDDRFVCIVSDRTDARARLSDLRRRAEYDDLTGLHVRAIGLRELDRRTAPSSDGLGADDAPLEASSVTALLFCDLDRFKAVNDTGGHLAGDQVLATIAERLRRACEPDDVVCRWGGDEFGIIVERASRAEIVDLAHRLVAAVRALAEQAADSSALAGVGLSVGIALFTAGADRRSVVHAADEALYRSKTDPDESVHVQDV